MNRSEIIWVDNESLGFQFVNGKLRIAIEADDDCIVDACDIELNKTDTDRVAWFFQNKYRIVR